MRDFVKYPTVDTANIVGNMTTMRQVELPIRFEFAADELQAEYVDSSSNVVTVNPIRE